jgi:hypothetical protein
VINEICGIDISKEKQGEEWLHDYRYLKSCAKERAQQLYSVLNTSETNRKKLMLTGKLFHSDTKVRADTNNNAPSLVTKAVKCDW